MELRHLRYFTAVADTLNFHRAAEILHLAQPALSSQIKTLEDELGVKLFQRTTRSVSLTHAGRVFLEEARTVLASATQAENRARNAEHGLVGHLRIGLIAPTANAWLARILREFHQAYPGVQLSLFDLTSPEQINRLRSGELDAGLLRPPVGYADFDAMLVEESGQVLAMPAGHRLSRLKKLTWKDLDGEGLVMMDPRVQHGYYDTFLAACAKAGATPRPAQFAHDVQTKMWLISAGFGVSPVTDTLRQVKRPGLVFRPLPSGLPLVQTVLAWRKNDDSPVLSHFREAFKVLDGG
jgi:DNA-binding transcriptional LysR family regulator